MHRKFASGFSLIELMIVVSIISILSLIAIPSYQGYTERARFAEVIAAAQPFKIAVAIALQAGVAIDELINGNHGIPETVTPTKNLAHIKVNNGTIITTATELIRNATYILTPSSDGSNWSVSGSCVQYGFCLTT